MSDIANVVPFSVYVKGAGAPITREFEKSPPVGSTWLLTQARLDAAPNAAPAGLISIKVYIDTRLIAALGVGPLSDPFSETVDYNNPVPVYPNNRLRVVVTLGLTDAAAVELAVVQTSEPKVSVP